MQEFSESLYTMVLITSHCIQWISDVIVMGISAYFINKYDRGQHTTFDICISTIGVVFHLPGLLSPFVTSIGWMALIMDVIWSYLYITGFIFAGEDYNWLSCKDNAPPGASCSKKRAMEAFLFFGFFFSFLGAIVETLRMYQRKASAASHYASAPVPAPAPAPAPAPNNERDLRNKETV